MKTKTFTKILPVALALMLTGSGVFAEDNATSTLSFTVPSFTQITAPDSVTSSVTVQENYANIQLSPAMAPVFKVYNNDPDVTLTLSATVDATSATKPAMYSAESDGTALNVIFANSTAERKPSDEEVDKILNKSDAKNSVDCFAIAVTPNIKLAPNSGAQQPTASFSANTVKYPIKNGIYDITYNFAQSANADTFSTLDTEGVYKATLKLSRTAP